MEDTHESKKKSSPTIAIACGGSGGHLFPGVAIAEEFTDFGIQVELFITSKKVDEAGVSTLKDIRIHKLPGKPFSLKNLPGFLYSLLASYLESCRQIERSRPSAMIATGSFACLGPVLAARRAGARIYLHEANSIPGRAVRMLAANVDRIYSFFPGIDKKLREGSCLRLGMPVRRQFEPFDPVACRLQLGLRSDGPTLLVMGGSQGARPLNNFLFNHIREIELAIPNLQIIHITGPYDFEKSVALSRRDDVGLRIIPKPFLTEMEFAYGAANVALCRSGASTIAELAAMGVPSILVPYPHSADGHQDLNARLVSDSGAAVMCRQKELTPENVLPVLKKLLFSVETRTEMKKSLKDWHFPDAASSITEDIINHLGLPGKRRTPVFTFEKHKFSESEDNEI